MSDHDSRPDRDTEPTQPLGHGAAGGGSPSWLPPARQLPPAWQQPPTTQPLAVPIGQARAQGGGHGRVSGWVWPAVAGLALLVGLVGGAVGGALLDSVTESTQPGTVSDGLQGVDTNNSAPLTPDNRSVVKVAQQLLPSTVQIVAEYEGRAGGATGSGFVLDRQGHIVTNNHVVASAAESGGSIQIVDRSGKRFDAEVVGRSPVYDLAVLYTDRASALPPAPLGAAKQLSVGEPVVAFGSPLGLSSTVTSGIVSALNRPVTTGETGSDTSFINAVQTDAAINPGNSGGPLVNLRGQVVGVNSAIATTGGFGAESGNIGVGFAIPIEQVRITADQILRTGEARYPVIGATVKTGGSAAGPGARIEEVMSGTPAEDSGLQKGDVITEVDGHRVIDGIALIVAIRTYQPGETIRFTIERGGDERVLSITLDSEVG